MRKAILLIAAAMLITASMAGAASVVGSGHDLSSGGPNAAFRATNTTRVCVFCHTPHQSDAPFYDVDPLWNHTESVSVFNVYDSVTLQADQLVAPDQAITPIVTGTVSFLCMSCHDGTIGLGSLLNDPNVAVGGVEVVPDNVATKIAGNPLLGTDLSNDHPINFTYDASLVALDANPAELVTPASLTAVDAGGQIPLFANSTVQCASCHDVHDPQFIPFLNVDNAASALCLQCHIK